MGVLVPRPYRAVDAERHVHRGRVRVAGVDVRLLVPEDDDGRLLTRTCDIGSHVDPSAPRAQMEVVDGGQVVDLSMYLPGGSTVVTSAPSSVVRLISYASGSSVDPTVPMSFGRPVVDVSVVAVSVAMVFTVVADPSSFRSPHPTAASATTASPMGSAKRMALI